MEWLAASRPGFAEALAMPGVVRAAVNQDYAQPADPVQERPHCHDRRAVADALAAPGVVRAAVNQDYAQPGDPVRPGDEVAFFPPVTGG